MPTVQTVIESIVSDLIQARHTADRKTAALAEQYRDDPILQSMNVPALNISEVEIDLKVGLASEQIQSKPSSRAGRSAVSLAKKESANIARQLAALPSIKQKMESEKLTIKNLESNFNKALIAGIEDKKSVSLQPDCASFQLLCAPP